MGAGMGLVDLIQLSFAEVLEGRLPPGGVIKLLITKMLGYLILAGATFVKVPQILDVVRAKSAEGLNSLSSELEVFGFFVHFAYGYSRQLPFSAFGECVPLLLQTLWLLLLVNKYSSAPWYRSALVVSLLCGAGTALYTGQISAAAISRAYDLNNLVFTAARVPQIVTNFKNKSTGQLNIVTAVMNLGGSVARVFTSIQEGGGTSMVRGYAIGVAMNVTLLAQILYYGKKQKKQ